MCYNMALQALKLDAHYIYFYFTQLIYKTTKTRLYDHIQLLQTVMKYSLSLSMCVINI